MKPIAFVVVSLILLYISRASLQSPGSHGFYRFFAWESILGLFLLNMNFWFYKPFSWNQIIAWILLCLSLILLGYGINALRTRGKPADERPNDPTLLAFEKTTRLVTSGIYHYIRHPLYSSLLFLAWGIFFKLPSWIGIVLAILATTFLIATAKADEMECIQFFGAAYRDYRKKTKMFIPTIF